MRKQVLSFFFALALTVGANSQGRAQTTVYNQATVVTNNAQLEGIAKAKEAGVYKGRPGTWLKNERGLGPTEIAARLKIGRVSIHRVLKEIAQTGSSRATISKIVKGSKRQHTRNWILCRKQTGGSNGSSSRKLHASRRAARERSTGPAAIRGMRAGRSSRQVSFRFRRSPASCGREAHFPLSSDTARNSDG